ncbi:MAG: Lin0512 family protein [Proteobacteria bacterium]|nr:Lin0512 family protein [Pseudomonadota bacterium]
MRHYLIELGTGTDLHKPDATKCAVRAVRDAIGRCSMVGLFECGLVTDIQQMTVKVKIGVPFPDQVDTEAVAREIPYGQSEIEVVPGGLLEEGSRRRDGSRDKVMVAVAAITVMVP